ncbi:dipeptidyl peptidase 3 [Bacteroidales bacterium OttesenSCG-928-B11]|nr:dipeptidyl peptidase 3 [Bacteroidales bacterium OttesenSCG-928-C03]MDL2312401.1 dipeptidyl peptidase 3 [Bacteroidales bacterium OttesenSCG-928-B11]
MKKLIILIFPIMLFIASCNQISQPSSEIQEQKDDFEYVVDRFADIQIMRYTVDDWDKLSLQQKTLLYYLSEAALCGRDIIFDQNCKYNLDVKAVLTHLVNTYEGEKKGEQWEQFVVYVKRFLFSNGMHHHYSGEKFLPEISKDYFTQLLDNSLIDSSLLIEGEDIAGFKSRITDIIFNPDIAPSKSMREVSRGKDLLAASSVNFYDDVSQKEVELFYENLKKSDKDADPERPVSYGLNSKVIKNEKGQLEELPYKVGGLYSEAIEKIVFYLEKAAQFAENELQRKHIAKLVEYYQTGDLKTWDDYNVLWAADVDSQVDYVNGFIEVYEDPLGRKGTWEALVNIKDEEESKRTHIIAENAQWFEDNSPIDDVFKKKEVKGVSAKVINAVQLGGECYPASPLGINLPNADWIRKEHGSKSVTIKNVMRAYDMAEIESGLVHEFYYSDYEIGLAEKYGSLTRKLQVDLHECLGHGSGITMPGVDESKLSNYYSTIEEMRADLFSLYFLADPKMVELGLLPNEEAYMSCFYKYITNGLMLQLNRIDLGEKIKQAHMQNRSIIAQWCYENGKIDNVIELETQNGKTYVVINDYEKLRDLMGKLLKEAQRIKSTGDYAAAKMLVETYGVTINPDLHQEVKDRYVLLDMAPYGGFLNPVLIPVMKDDEIVDVRIEYPTHYMEQMLMYEQKYHYLK